MIKLARVVGALVGLSSACSSAWAADLPRVCDINGARRIADKLEAYVQSGVGFITKCENNDCCIRSKFREILLLQRNKNASVWARAVYFDRLSRGIPAKSISATMVDSSGREIGLASGEYELQNSNMVTDLNGFAFLPVVVRFTDKAPTAKIYLLRFSYSDRDSISFSYGPYFYIREEHPALETLERLRIQGFTPSEVK